MGEGKEKLLEQAESFRWTHPMEGGKEGGEEELLDRTFPLSTLPCRAEQSRAERRQRGRGWNGREGDVRPSVRVGLIRHDRTRLGAPPSITRTRLGRPSEVGTRTPNSMVVVALKKGKQGRERRGEERHVH